MSKNNFVLINEINHLGIITLNRPSALNALTYEMTKIIYDKLLSWQEDHEIWAVIIESAVPKIFCAGGDIKALYNQRDNYSLQMQFFAAEYQLNKLIHDYKKPYISLLSGITMGGGAGISLHGSYPIATEDFEFAMPETAIGFFPDVGVSHILSKLPKEWQDYIGVYGSRIKATEAYNLGLIKAIVPANMLYNFKQKLLQNPNNLKKIIKQFQPKKNKNIKIPNVKGHNSSPLSMAVTSQQLFNARSKNLVQCLEADYKLAGHFMKSPEFYEGVRAMLIDKDKSPHWQYLTIEEIPDSVINSFFI